MHVMGWQILIDPNLRQDFEELGGKTRLLACMAQKLMAVAENYDVAVSQEQFLTLFMCLL
jgi:hypothetical protein